MIAALLFALLATLPVGGQTTDRQWRDRAIGSAGALAGLPAEERAEAVLELERLYDEGLERGDAPGASAVELAWGRCWIANALGGVDESLLELATRAEWIGRAALEARGTQDASLVAATGARFAAFLRDAGSCQDALAAIAEARAWLDGRPEAERARGALGAAQLANLEGDVLRLVGRYDAALARLDEAERLRASLADEDPAKAALVPPLLGRRFDLFLDLGLRELAHATWRQERAAAERTQHPADLTNAALHELHLLSQAERYDEAEGLAQEALSARRGSDAYEAALFAWLRAKNLDRAEWVEPERPRAARAQLVALVEARTLRGTDQLYALCTLARRCWREGELEAAEGWLARAREELAALGGRETLELFTQEHWIAALAAELALDRGAPRGELDARRRELEQATERFLEVWAGVETRTGGLGFLQPGRRSSSISALLRLVLACPPDPAAAGGSAEEQALAWLQAALARGFLARELAGGRPAATPDLAELRARLVPPEGGLLVYLLAEERGHVFAVDREVVLAVELPPEHVVAERRAQLLAALLHPVVGAEPGGDGRFRAASRALADVLIPAKIRERVRGWRTLTVCGRSTLGYVPFEALLLGEELLGDERAVSMLASPSLGVELLGRERPPRAEEELELLLVAATSDSARGEADAPLAWTPSLERRLVAPYERARVLLGDEATLPRLRGALERGAPLVLQVVAHAGSRRTPELERHLRLAPAGAGDDGRVGHAGLRALAVPRLAVLASCAAARADERPGDDGIADLSGALLLGGASAVVAAELDLYFEPAMELCAVFHARLARGDSPAQALLAARRALRDSEPYAHPALRSTLHVTGLGHHPLAR